MKAKTAVIAVVLVLLVTFGISFADESISGTVISVDFTPGCYLADGPCVIVRFTDQKKVFVYNALVNEITANEFNTIYYNERCQITRVKTRPGQW